MKTEFRLILLVLYKQFLNIHSKKGSVLKSPCMETQSKCWHTGHITCLCAPCTLPYHLCIANMMFQYEQSTLGREKMFLNRIWDVAVDTMYI